MEGNVKGYFRAQKRVRCYNEGLNYGKYFYAFCFLIALDVYLAFCFLKKAEALLDPEDMEDIEEALRNDEVS